MKTRFLPLILILLTVALLLALPVAATEVAPSDETTADAVAYETFVHVETYIINAGDLDGYATYYYTNDAYYKSDSMSIAFGNDLFSQTAPTETENRLLPGCTTVLGTTGVTALLAALAGVAWAFKKKD